MSYNDYESYEQLFDPMNNDRQARRKRKPKANHTPKKDQQEILEEIVDPMGLEGGFDTTYKPSKHEAEWLLSSLETFYQQAIITDVEALVKGGKEASVYRCEAHPSTGREYIAAKVYRPRMFRSLTNDAVYRQGRTTLNIEGKEIKENESRVMRAIDNKSAYGQLVAHTSWLMHEYTTMQSLLALGADVPEVIGAGENAILMDYLGDGSMAAPTLSEVSISPDEAQPLFRTVMRNIELMLQQEIIHGDLSAYNILYWEGAVTLIDFPQVVNSNSNGEARDILERDITRVCEYFSAHGVDCDPQRITRQLWGRYAEKSAKDAAADLSRLLYSPEDEEDDSDDE